MRKFLPRTDLTEEISFGDEKMENQEFRTLKGYQIKNNSQITYAMEDYLEMICRYCQNGGYARIGHLAEQLNVKPSSCSKMVGHLKNLGLVDYEKYGIIKPTQRGAELGEYLLYRHRILNDFLCYLNHTDDELEQVEQIEHFFKEQTIRNLEKLLVRLKGEE